MTDDVIQGETQSYALSSRLHPVIEPGDTAAAVDVLAGTLIRVQIERGRRGLTLCAPASGAGVTLITAGLGLALTQAGLRTLIIDANLRNPAMHEHFVPRIPETYGLAQLLSESEAAAAMLPEREVRPGLSVIFAGPMVPAAHDLFDNQRFELLVRNAFRSFDITLVDAPPANRCGETRRIAAVTGYAALVARRDYTRHEDMGALLSDLHTSRTEVIGSIFNEG